MSALEDLANTRVDYTRGRLDAVDTSPLGQFSAWYEEAQGQVHEPNAMVVSTVDEQGPDGRIVLLKSVHPDGFVFFTNYESAKGRQLAADPHAALVFPWHEMQRSVRVRGIVEKVSAQESDEYFALRPRGSQLGAIASAQSAVIGSRAELEAAYAAAEAAAGQGAVTRPDYWGGYLVRPYTLEFWQGRSSRLHDRFRYTVAGGTGTHRPAGGQAAVLPALDDAAAWDVHRLNP